MSFWTLVWRGLTYYWRTHLGVLGGATVAVAVLVGALGIGDSVRFSLRQITLTRLGQVTLALTAGDRTFRAALADDLGRALVPAQTVAALLVAEGIALRPDRAARVNHIQLLGVDAAFWALAPEGPPPVLPAQDAAVVNPTLADALGLRPGDELVVRLEKTGRMPRDTPLVSERETVLALRLTVQAVAGPGQFGRFSLRANPTPSPTVWVDRVWLENKLGQPGRANALLVGGTHPISTQTAQSALRQAWRLADAALEWRALPASALELRSTRVFLDPPAVRAAQEAFPGSREIITYFVNEIRSGARQTPYSFVSAPGTGLVPAGLANDEIVLNDWLARDLEVKPGSALELVYYVPGAGRELAQKTNQFRVRAIVPLSGPAADPGLAPDLPGLSGAAQCRDWDPGLPIALNRIRPQDEDYWKDHRGTPKAFLSAAAARQMWTTRFGTVTALRFPAGTNPVTVEPRILAQLDPAALGLAFRPVRAEGLEATRAAMDLGQLFLGLSLFLVAAALLLTGLLFVFGIEQRAGEAGTLRALGFERGDLRRLRLAEGAVLAVVAAGLGMLGGWLYDRAVLEALGSIWRDAVGAAPVTLHLTPLSLLGGALGGALTAWVSMLLALRRQNRFTPRELQTGDLEGAANVRSSRAWPAMVVALAAAVGAGLVLGDSAGRRGPALAATFFAAGSLIFLAELALGRVLLIGLGRARSFKRLNVLSLAARNCTRHPGRSLATAALLAGGLFLVVAVAANRHDPVPDPVRPEAGTGGFTLFGETALPVWQDLNSTAGRQRWGLDAPGAVRWRAWPFALRDGDDASCRNLNRVPQPRILGVNPAALDGRFTFAALDPGADPGHPWSVLDLDLGPDVVPAIADQTVIVWGLGKAVGESIELIDEYGKPFRLKFVGGLASSIFQGQVIIARQAFARRFPSALGDRWFLFETSLAQAEPAARTLGLALEDAGLEIGSAPRRLAEFNAVENTYLAIFLALGGWGLVLGTAGLGLVILRHGLERRGELALLRAVGFSRLSLAGQLLAEHGFLLGAGVIGGTAAAGLAVWPAVMSPGGQAPVSAVGLWIAALTVSGLAWTAAGAWWATRGSLLSALRGE